MPKYLDTPSNEPLTLVQLEDKGNNLRIPCMRRVNLKTTNLWKSLEWTPVRILNTSRQGPRNVSRVLRI